MSYKDAEMLVRAAELGEDSLQVLHMFKRVNIKILIIAALNPLSSSPVSRKYRSYRLFVRSFSGESCNFQFSAPHSQTVNITL